MRFSFSLLFSLPLLCFISSLFSVSVVVGVTRNAAPSFPFAEIDGGDTISFKVLTVDAALPTKGQTN